MKNGFLRRARVAAGIIFCMCMVTACKSGGGNVPAPIPVDAILGSGTVTLDVGNSAGNTGNANQSGTLTLVSDSGASTATFSGDPALVTPLCQDRCRL
jgi:hypothetical protein